MGKGSIERTCVIIKPDGYARKLAGEIIRKILNGHRKLCITYWKLVRPTRVSIRQFLPRSRAWGYKVGKRAIERFVRKGIDPKEIFGTDSPSLVARIVRANNALYYRMGPSLGLVVEGPDAIRIVRELCGNTSPVRANPGTIRGDYSADDFDIANKERRPCLNVIHSSSTRAEAERDIRWLLSEPDRIPDTGTSPILIGWLRKQHRWTTP